MRVGAVIYPILSGYTPLTDLIPATKMFAVRGQLETQAPYLVYREISSTPLNTTGDSTDLSADPRLSQRSILDVSRVQISVFADNYLIVENIAVMIREALDREWGAVISPYENDIEVDSIVYDNCNDDFDDDYGQDGIYMKHLEFTIRIRRLFTGQIFNNAYSLDFDGVDDYMTMGDADVFTPNSSGANRGFSISFWIKLNTGATASQTIMTKNGKYSLGAYHYEWELYTRTDSTVRFIMYGGDVNTVYMTFDYDSALEGDEWYHIVYTWDASSSASGSTGAAWKVYINGAENTNGDGATFSLTGTWAAVANTVNPLYIARTSGSQYGELKLDEISIWDDIISSSQVEIIYNAGSPIELNESPVNSSYLVGWWRNGDGATFPTIPDESANYSNAGTMTNMIAGDINTDTPG